MGLTGKKAVVTGSSSGIGRAIALAFAREGVDVVINGRDEKKIASVVKEVESIGGRALGLRADVSRFADVNDMMEKARAEFGGMDILVNNAGIFYTRPLLDMKEEEWDELVAIDLKSVFNCTRAVINDMIARGWGRVICITGLAGNTGYANTTHVAAAKSGVHGFVKALAREVASSEITVNAISPGLIDTPILAHMSEEQKESFAREIPAGRIGKSEEIAAASVYLASDAAAFITGQVLNIGGGQLI